MAFSLHYWTLVKNFRRLVPATTQAGAFHIKSLWMTLFASYLFNYAEMCGISFKNKQLQGLHNQE